MANETSNLQPENGAPKHGGAHTAGMPKYAKLTLLSILAVLLVLLIAAAAYFSWFYLGDRVFLGVRFGGQELGGRGYDAAAQLLSEEAKQKAALPLSIQYGEQTLSRPLDTLLAGQDFTAAAQQAYAVGRTGNLFRRIGDALGALFGGRVIESRAEPSDEALGRFADDFIALAERDYAPSSFEQRDTYLVVFAGQNETRFSRDALVSQLRAAATNLESTTIVPEAEGKQADFDADAIYAELHREAESARAEMGADGDYTIVPETWGLDFDLDEMKQKVEPGSGKTTLITIETVEPETTKAELEKLLFADLLAEKRTKLNPNLKGRTSNIRLACSFLNNTILMPDEVFSFNDIVGERTAARGFKEAIIYERGQKVDGLGGGICQVSSTIYSAVLRTEMEIVERKAHVFTVDYVPLGEDATLYWGSIDFRFKNTTGNPILIKAVQESNYVDIKIYGTKDPSVTTTISIKNVTVGTTPYETVYQEDPNMAPGTEKVTQTGNRGYVVESYKVYKDADGNVVEQKYLSKSRYKPANKIITRGPAVDPVGPTEPATPTEPTDPATPTGPTDPATPTGPVTPTQPTDPATPTGPTDPA
ncbi:VanW family protein [Feifania hominis]|uniref:VanW family protein n=1 Tax=Feifania hominis TaxID=2763660 RepID=A0A926DEX2_9FIRM|nr:VanW family protein [Feifania hominis]MBC8536878.1 VanW family protein [Feifania hominis]